MDVMIIGAGFIGRLHKRAWEHNGARVAAIVDPFLPEPARREYAASGTEVFDRIADAVRQVPGMKAASICTPPKFHAEALAELLELGIPVLMEKPVSAGRDDYLRMKEAASRSGVPVMIGLTQRFYPEVVKAAQWIREGRIGRPLGIRDLMILNDSGLPAWYYDREVSGGGILITNGVHLLDRIQYLMDGELEVTYHYDGVYDAGGIDRIALLSGRLNNGVSYQIYAEWSGVKERQETVIFGSEGRIELQSWSHARLHTADGITEEFGAYAENDDFEEKTLKGLSREVRTFVEGLASETGFPKGLSLDEHFVTMNAIWDAYRREGGVGFEDRK